MSEPNTENQGEKTFTQEQVNAIVSERVKKLQAQLDAASGLSKELEAIKAKLAEADEREKTAREEAELKGKSELEKLQIQLKKSTELFEATKRDHAKALADEQAKVQAATNGLSDYVRRHLVQSALAEAGVSPKATKDAVLAFMSEAQIELGETHDIKALAVGGKTFEKATEAAKHFLSEKPYFAAAPQGGNGTPRPNGGGAGAPVPNSLGGLLQSGLGSAKT